VDIEFARVAHRLAERDIAVTLTPEGREFLIEKGFSPEFGARPLRRAIEKHIEDPLAEELLRNQFVGGANMRILVRDDHLFFETITDEQDGEPEPAAATAPGADADDS